VYSFTTANLKWKTAEGRDWSWAMAILEGLGKQGQVKVSELQGLAGFTKISQQIAIKNEAASITGYYH